MTESDEIRPRQRWFQFDLRLLFVIIAAVSVILALEVARGSRTTPRKLLNTLSVGDVVYVYTRDDGGVTIYYDESRSSSYPSTITEIGDDFVAIRYPDDVEVFVPLDRLQAVRRYSEPSIAKTAKTPRPVPTKTFG